MRWVAFSLGDWSVQPALNRLERGEKRVQIEPRLMDALVQLAERPGEVVAREELYRALWGETTVVEKSLTNVISELRQALEDDPEQPRYIETVRKRGYRLLAPVRPILDLRPMCGTHAPLYAALIAIALPLLVVLALASLLWRSPDPALKPPLTMPILPGIPLTSYPGSELHPALSPDGTRVAFTWSGQDNGNYDIYIIQPDTAVPLRLTDHPATDCYPAWSPDGTQLAFARLGAEAGLYTVPSLGGPERRLSTTASEVLGVAWSPDGRWIAYAAAAAPGEYVGILLLSLETLVVEPLVAAAGAYHCAFLPAFAPDGRTLAFARSDIANFNEVYTLDLATRETRQITSARRPIEGLDWMPDGRHLIVSRAPLASGNLTRVSVEDGSTERIPTRSRCVRGVTVARRGGSLVYEELNYNYDIWSVPLDVAGIAGRPRPVAPSSRSDYAPACSPDGTRIAFISDRSGNREIWIADRDGSHPHQLTRLAAANLSRPIWAPSGESLAFSCERDGYAAAHVVDCASGRVRRLGGCGRHEVPTCWPPDGSWIYLDVDSGRGWQLARVSPQGAHAQSVLESGHGLECLTSDGRLIYRKGESPELYELVAETAAERVLVPAQVSASWPTYAVIAEGVYAVARQEGFARLVWLDFSTGAVRDLGELPSGVSDLCVAVDRRSLLFTRTESFDADLILCPGGWDERGR